MTTKNCPLCDGNGCYLGTLGFLRHYRCQDCGWDYSGQSKKRRKPVVRKATPEEAARFLAQGTPIRLESI